MVDGSQLRTFVNFTRPPYVTHDWVSSLDESRAMVTMLSVADDAGEKRQKSTFRVGGS